MEARVAVLEEIAASIKASLVRLEGGQDRLRAAQDQLREDMHGGQNALRADLRTGLEAARDRHDRDFRITFGAIIAMALGLAGLLAKGFKWI